MARSKQSGSRDAESWWVLGGRQGKRILVRRISFPFEVRRHEGEATGELRIYAPDVVHRWRIPLDADGELSVRSRVASELERREVDECDFEMPIWDHGRCVLESHVGQGLRAAIESGRLEVTLHGEHLWGAHFLERTPMTLLGSPQWLVWKEDGVPPHAGR